MIDGFLHILFQSIQSSECSPRASILVKPNGSYAWQEITRPWEVIELSKNTYQGTTSGMLTDISPTEQRTWVP
jgi:hypothetical protein